MVKFYLATPRRDKSAINIAVSFRGRQFRRTTKESTLVRFWGQEQQRVRVTKENRLANRTNDIIEQWRVAATNALLKYKYSKELPTSTEFFDIIDAEFYKNTGFVNLDRLQVVESSSETPSFTDYFLQYINRYSGVRAVETVKRYHTTLNKLIRYEQLIYKKLTFADINIDFYNQFRIWIYNQNYSDNYFGSLIKVIKQVYREAREADHLHELNGIAHKGFVTVMKESDSIFLTVEELMRLHHMELTEQKIVEAWPELKDHDAIKKRITTCELVKNRFLIGAFSGLRVSDYSRLGELNIVDGMIALRTKKTDTPIIIPVHPVVADIIKRGFDLSKTISDQKMNTYIKPLAKMAKIEEKVAIREYRGGVSNEVSVEKYKLVCTHTARRSFATNLSKMKDVPLSAISKALGHTKITTTMRYLRIGAEENAAILAESAYFRSDSSVKTPAEEID